MRVRLASVGCRLNLGEVESMARDLVAAGHRIAGPDEAADVCILNSCAVTGVAARTSRQSIRRLRRRHPDAVLVATGCYSELAADRVTELGVDLTIANADKDRLPELLEQRGVLGSSATRGQSRPATPTTARVGSRTRAFLKVQDGCDNRCAFCVVTLARGPARSRPAGEVVAEVRRMELLGYREVVLSGVQLGSYGRDLGLDLADLVRRVLHRTGVPRLRLSSLEPWDLEPDFFELFDDPRMLPHIHLPLQSGCDATLARMSRRTRRRDFARLVAAARAAVPALSVSTDVMVGFPGETDDEFRDSLSFIREMAFSRLHVFRFSPRAGTRAATMSGQVPAAVADRRARTLRALAIELEENFNRSFVGSRRPVLWERARPAEPGAKRWTGLTDNFIHTVTDTACDAELANRISDTLLVATVRGGVLGSLSSPELPGGNPALPVLDAG